MQHVGFCEIYRDVSVGVGGGIMAEREVGSVELKGIIGFENEVSEWHRLAMVETWLCKRRSPAVC